MERQSRKNIRLCGYDYRMPGGYFITICTKGKQKLFWSVGASCARPVLSEYGTIVSDELAGLAGAYENVRLEKAVVMPNHVHMLLIIETKEGGRAQLAPTVSHIVQQFKGKVTKRMGQSPWQKGYYDHIVRNYEDYLRIWEYIDTNPARWTEDRYYSEETRDVP